MSAPFHSSNGQLTFTRVWITGGGYLKDTDARLAAKFTSLLGARGTGKTTLLLLIAFVLELPLNKKQEAQVKANLAGGRVHVEARVGQARYELARSFGQAKTGVFNENSDPVNMSVQSDTFAVDCYWHDQLGDIADDENAQLALLDRLIGKPMVDVQARIVEAEKAIAKNVEKLLELHTECEKLAHDAALADDVARRLDPMTKPKDGPDKERIEKAHAHRLLRTRELTTAQSARAAITTARKALAVALANAGESLGIAIGGDLLEGPNGSLMRGIEGELTILRDAIKKAAVGLDAQAILAEGGLAKMQEVIALAQAKQEQEDAAVLARHEEDNAVAVARLDLQEQYAAVMEAPTALGERQARFSARRAESKELLAELRKLRARRSQLRRETEARVNKLLKDEVQIVVEEDGNCDAYEKSLAASLQGVVTTHLAIAKKLAKVPPETLSVAVEAHDAGVICEHTGVKPESAGAILDALSKWPNRLAFESAIIDDTAKIQLMDGGWQSIREVSDGQRITALLPIIMMESTRPLIIDQPEDHLDNQFIYERVVKMGILLAKEQRQILFATHSANIAILGESETRLVATKVARKLGRITEAKDLAEALRLLEGGKEALLARVKRYGLD